MFRLRYVVGILGSAAITAGLFLFMMGLVKTEKQTEEVDEVDPIIIGRTVPDTPAQKKIRKPEKQAVKPKPPKPPVLKTEVVIDQNNSSGDSFDLDGFEPVVSQGGFQDGRAIPMVQIPPIYPERCRSRGLEGRVVLEFDVTELGTVENVRVIESYPGSCFDKASIKAIKQWKYRPKTINGRAVPQLGVQEAIEYEFEDDA